MLMLNEIIDKINNEMKRYGENINDGAMDDEIEVFSNEVNKKLNIKLPQEYCIVLKLVNGLEFNGFIIYGIDEYLLKKDINQHINGFIDNNLICYDNEWLKQYIFFGESDISWYVYDISSKMYFEIDRPSEEKMVAFIISDWHRLFRLCTTSKRD